MEELNEYYRERERKNNELVVTAAYAIAIGFGLLCLYGAGKLLFAAARWLF